MRRVRAQPVPLACNRVPVAREVSVVVAMSGVCDVVSLADVERLAVALTVVRVVTHRLHAIFGAFLDHDVLVFARGAGCLHNAELVSASLYAVLCPKRNNER